MFLPHKAEPLSSVVSGDSHRSHDALVALTSSDEDRPSGQSRHSTTVRPSAYWPTGQTTQPVWAVLGPIPAPHLQGMVILIYAASCMGDDQRCMGRFHLRLTFDLVRGWK